MAVKTYEIEHDGRAIHCLICDRTSHNSDDVKYRFCACCGVFHDDLARRGLYDAAPKQVRK